MTNDRLIDLTKTIEAETGVSDMDMLSKSRKEEICRARYLFFYFSKTHLNWTERQVASYLKKNRTMYYHFQKRHDEYLQHNKEYQHIFHSIRKIMDVGFVPIPKQIILTKSEKLNQRLLNYRMLIGLEPIDNSLDECVG